MVKWSKILTMTMAKSSKLPWSNGQKWLFFPVSCHLGPKGPNGKIVLIRFVHVHKKYKTRVGDRQRKSGYFGILAQKVSVRTYARINYAPLSNLTMLMYTTKFQLHTAYTVKCT